MVVGGRWHKVFKVINISKPSLKSRGYKFDDCHDGHFRKYKIGVVFY